MTAIISRVCLLCIHLTLDILVVTFLSFLVQIILLMTFKGLNDD